jgi:hypothetical protein
MIRTDHAADDGGPAEGATPGHDPYDGPALPTDPEARPHVTIAAKDFRLPVVLSHIEAGRVVVVPLGISAPAPAADPDTPNPRIKAKPKKGSS